MLKSPKPKVIDTSRFHRSKPSERDIQRACDDFIQLDDWRVIVTDPPQLRGLGVSEKGIPDRLYIRYRLFEDLHAVSQVLWIEWKRPRGKASANQKAWHLLERKRGALVWVAGEDFEASYDGFVKWYRASGLLRRQGL